MGAAGFGFFEELAVGDDGVGVQARGGGVGGDGWRRLWPVVELAGGPGDEVLPVGSVGVAAVVLAPGESAVEQAENLAGGNGCHEAALLVEPAGVAFLR